MSYKTTKRLIDIVLAATFIVVAAPLWLLILAVLTIEHHGRPLFTQLRPGLHIKPFHIYKFRTLNDYTDEQGRLLPDQERLTVIGRWLRRFSLDELPQLINVLKGEMSIVGPRPLLMEFLEYYTPEQLRRHEVRPGITGLTQVNGRNALTWEEKFKMDNRYIESISFRTDLTVLLKSIPTVLTARGLRQEGEFSSEEFRG